MTSYKADAALSPDPTYSALFQQQQGNVPAIKAGYWSFMLGGAVDVPLFLSYADLLTLPAIEIDCVVACAGHGETFGQARWQGVEMRTLLREVRFPADHQPEFAHLHSADAYRTCITFELLENSILVYGMNGSTLPPEHGFPARLIVPGLYGYKMPKWIQRIVLADVSISGFWEQRGWSQAGEAGIHVRIEHPAQGERIDGRIRLEGMAYAGGLRIGLVEISVDDGPWMPAAVQQGSVHEAARWVLEWTAPSPGEHLIRARAHDAQGNRQAETHSIVVYSL